jgi:hypothetical protein
MARRLVPFILIVMTLLSTGCVQEHLVIPVGTVTGRVRVPAGQVPLGIKITVAGHSNNIYVNESGDYKLEFTKPGRYLLVARGRDFDVDFRWVDVLLEETTGGQDFSLRTKLVGEAMWIATIVDFPDATAFKIKSLDPVWATSTIPLYDDGTHGDKLAGDGIFTNRLMHLTTGSQLYSLVWSGPDGDKEVKDPHRENERTGLSEIYVPEPAMKVARGVLNSALTGVNYSEVVVSTKAGARKINAGSDGQFAIAMEGIGREYLVFRSNTFHIRAIPVDLTTMPIYDVPPVSLAAKAANEAKFILVKSDFQDVTAPMVVADFTNWQPQALYDDGTNGDEVAGDGVYTRVFTNVSPGYHKYAFNITAMNQVRDPYEESTDGTYSILLVK